MTRFGDEGGDVGAEPVLLQRLLPAVVASEEGRWPGVTFELDLPAGLPTVIADPTYVEQVVRNLLSNAAKYGGAGDDGPASRSRPTTGEVIVRILDDGPGFPPDEADEAVRALLPLRRDRPDRVGRGDRAVRLRPADPGDGRPDLGPQPRPTAAPSSASPCGSWTRAERPSDPGPPAGDAEDRDRERDHRPDDDEEVGGLVEERQLEVHAHDPGQDDRRAGRSTR